MGSPMASVWAGLACVWAGYGRGLAASAASQWGVCVRAQSVAGRAGWCVVCGVRVVCVCVCSVCGSNDAECACVHVAWWCAGLRLVFIDGNHFYQGVSEDFIALESQGDLFMFHDIASEQFVEHTKKLFDEVAAKPAFECRKFVDNYPTGRVGFGIGVCVRRVFLSGPGSVLSVAGPWVSTPSSSTGAGSSSPSSGGRGLQ